MISKQYKSIPLKIAFLILSTFSVSLYSETHSTPDSDNEYALISETKVIFVPGIGGMDKYAEGFYETVQEEGFDIEAVDWIQHTFKLLNLRDAEAQEVAVNKLKERLISLNQENKKVVLVGHSTGTYIISKALSDTEIKVALQIQMAAAYYSEAVLKESVTNSNQTLFLYSPHDLMVSVGTIFSGTNDGFYEPALGSKGPKHPIPGIELIEYKKEWKNLGHPGNHEGYLAPDFFKGKLKGMILESLSQQ